MSTLPIIDFWDRHLEVILNNGDAAVPLLMSLFSPGNTWKCALTSRKAIFNGVEIRGVWGNKEQSTS
jgi:hypothetical protein